MRAVDRLIHPVPAFPRNPTQIRSQSVLPAVARAVQYVFADVDGAAKTASAAVEEKSS